MVSVTVSKLGCTELFFVGPGVKVDDRYYREVLPKKQMLPVMRYNTQCSHIERAAHYNRIPDCSRDDCRLMPGVDSSTAVPTD